MAFAGLHVALSYVGGHGFGQDTLSTVMSRPIWSETMASPATTVNVVPRASDGTFEGRPVLRVNASVDSYVAFDQSPNATTGARALCRAGVDYMFFPKMGDRVAFILA